MMRITSRQLRLAAKLGCENVEFLGHRDVSFWMSEEFANVILSTLKRHGVSYACLFIITDKIEKDDDSCIIDKPADTEQLVKKINKVIGSRMSKVSKSIEA